MSILLFLCLSILFLGIGIYKLKGPVSVWYLSRSPHAIGGSYLAIPIGIVFFLWTLALLPFIPVEWAQLLAFVGAIGGLVSPLLARIFTPSWLKWLKKEHGDILPFLQNEIYEMGYENWDEMINTQEELEAWVLTMRRKYGVRWRTMD